MRQQPLHRLAAEGELGKARALRIAFEQALAFQKLLAEPAAVEQVFEACFSETATLGLRWQMLERRVLARQHQAIEVGGRSVRVKLADRPGVRTAKAESDDLLAVKGGRAAREVTRREAEQAGLKKDG